MLRTKSQINFEQDRFFLSRRKRQAADNQMERVEMAARTYPTEVPSIRWDGMFKTGVLLIWVSEENKNNVRWKCRSVPPLHTTGHPQAQRNSVISEEAVFSVVIITVPGLSTIHQSAAFYQNRQIKQMIFIITRRFTTTFTNKEWRGWG